MNIERVEFWGACLGNGQFESAVRAFPEEATALFGAPALQRREPVALSLIVFARRTLLMTDAQIQELEKQIRKDSQSAEASSSDGPLHFYIPMEQSGAPEVFGSPFPLPQDQAAFVRATYPERMRILAKQILLANGLEEA